MDQKLNLIGLSTMRINAWWSHILFSWKWSSGYVWRYHYYYPHSHTQNYEEESVPSKLPPFYPNIDYIYWLELTVLCNLFSFFTKRASFFFALLFFCLGCVVSSLLSCSPVFLPAHLIFEQTLSVTAVNREAERIEYKRAH